MLRGLKNRQWYGIDAGRFGRSNLCGRGTAAPYRHQEVLDPRLQGRLLGSEVRVVRVGVAQLGQRLPEEGTSRLELVRHVVGKGILVEQVGCRDRLSGTGTVLRQRPQLVARRGRDPRRAGATGDDDDSEQRECDLNEVHER